MKIEEAALGIRVVTIDELHGKIRKGIIVHIPLADGYIGVEFDEKADFMHNCNGYARAFHGYYLVPCNLKIYPSKVQDLFNKEKAEFESY